MEALQVRRPRPRRRDRQPDLRPRPRRSRAGTSMGLVRRFLPRRIPVYVDGALNIVDVRDVAAGHLLADEKGEIGERYILGGRNFTLDRLFADLARISGRRAPGAEAPGVRSRSPAPRLGRARLGLPLPTAPGRDPIGVAVVDLPQREGEAASSASGRARTRRRSRRRSSGSWPSSATASRAQRPARGLARCGLGRPGCWAERMRSAAMKSRCSIAARRRPTSSARAGRSSDGCAGSGSSTATERVPYRRRGPARDRGADPPEARPGPGRRRRGGPRLEADPRVPGVEVRAATAPHGRAKRASAARRAQGLEEP